MSHIPTIAELADLPSVAMSLRCVATSDTAHDFIISLADRINRRSAGRKPLRNHIRILGAVIADLLKAAALPPPHPCFRPMRAKDFTGTGVGFSSFKAVLSDLVTAGYVIVCAGYANPNWRDGKVTRILPTPKLLDELATAGLTPGNRNAHFADLSGEPLVRQPIQLRAAATRNFRFDKFRGQPLPVDFDDPQVQALAAEVSEINEFLAQQSYEGMVFEGLFRGFNQGDDPRFAYDQGGRLYAVGGGYQAVKRNLRRSIRINDEPTAEVDISASHLTILHALLKVRLPGSGDPYEISGLDRDPIKRFITASIGNGKAISKWPKEAAKDYAEDWAKNPKTRLTGNLQKDFPIRTVREAVLNHLPLLNDLSAIPYRWADIQFLESQVLIQAICALIIQGVPALPLHDALIVPISHKELASEILDESFHMAFGVKPSLKIKKLNVVDIRPDSNQISGSIMAWSGNSEILPYG
jgi:hypothetical protein